MFTVDVKQQCNNVTTSLTMIMSIMHFLIGIMFILKAIKFNFIGSYDKQNLTLMVISYEIFETSQRLGGRGHFIRNFI